MAEFVHDLHHPERKTIEDGPSPVEEIEKG
jgi:hypothetical protein